MHMQPVFIDMFSGAGLFSAGAVAHGMRPAFAIDVSKEAIASYNRNVAPVAVVGSVTEWTDIPAADVLIAGPPCQGFSTLGRQDPLDARNDLALAVPAWAGCSGASVVVVENVPPFLRSPQWRVLADAFRDCGYEVDSWELNAVDFGAPQLRRRSFTIASRVGMPARPVGTGERLVAGEYLPGPARPPTRCTFGRRRAGSRNGGSRWCPRGRQARHHAIGTGPNRDRRFAQVVTDTMAWARDNPEAIYLHSSGKLARQGHMPNTVAFGNLMDGMEQQSKAWGRPIELIRHDRQNEFAGALAFWHICTPMPRPRRSTLC